MAELPPECKTNFSGGVPALTQNTDADGVGPQPATLGGEPDPRASVRSQRWDGVRPIRWSRRFSENLPTNGIFLPQSVGSLGGKILLAGIFSEAGQGYRLVPRVQKMGSEKGVRKSLDRDSEHRSP